MISLYVTVRRLLLSWEPFDPDACGLVVRWAAVFCIAAVMVAMSILLIARDGTPNCLVRAGLWPVVIIFAPAAAWMGYVAMFWKQFSRDIALHERAHPLHSAMLPMNSLLVRVVIGWCGFCSIPLVMLLVSC